MAEAEIFQKCGQSKSPRDEWRQKTCVEFRKKVYWPSVYSENLQFLNTCMATARPLIPAFMKPFAEDDFPRGQRRDSTYEYRTIIHKSGPRRICWTLLDRAGDCDNDVFPFAFCPAPADSRRLLAHLPLVIAWPENAPFRPVDST